MHTRPKCPAYIPGTVKGLLAGADGAIGEEAGVEVDCAGGEGGLFGEEVEVGVFGFEVAVLVVEVLD